MAAEIDITEVVPYLSRIADALENLCVLKTLELHHAGVPYEDEEKKPKTEAPPLKVPRGYEKFFGVKE